MLLHAIRLMVPRGNRAAIDVSAPLPDYWAEWRDMSSQGNPVIAAKSQDDAA
jgi:tRNA pseudouridine32 synthase/23S rRNA pseudouridine746 synthase